MAESAKREPMLLTVDARQAAHGLRRKYSDMSELAGIAMIKQANISRGGPTEPISVEEQAALDDYLAQVQAHRAAVTAGGAVMADTSKKPQVSAAEAEAVAIQKNKKRPSLLQRGRELEQMQRGEGQQRHLYGGM